MVSFLMVAHHVLRLTFLIKSHVFGRYPLLRRALRIPKLWAIQIAAMSNRITGPFCNIMARTCKPIRDYAVVSLASVPYLARRTIHPRFAASNPTTRPPSHSLLPFGPKQGAPVNFAFEIRTRSPRMQRMEYCVYTRARQTIRQ